MGVCGGLANALDLKSSCRGSTPGRDRVKRFHFFHINTCADSSVPDLPLFYRAGFANTLQDVPSCFALYSNYIPGSCFFKFSSHY